MGVLALVHVVVVLVLTLLCLALGGSFAARPRERTLAVLRPLALALLFATLASTLSGLTLTATSAASHPPDGPPLAGMVFAGLAEAAVFAVFGFAVLTVTWALVALGLHRQD